MVSFRSIACEDSSDEAVNRVICDSQSVFNAALSTLKLEDSSDRSKNFLSDNFHAWVAISKESWLDVKSRFIDAVSTSHKSCTFFLTSIDVTEDLGQLLFGNNGSFIESIFSPVAHLKSTDGLDKLCNELFVNGLLNDQASRSTAHLTRVDHSISCGARDCFVKVAVCKDNQRAFTTEL